MKYDRFEDLPVWQAAIELKCRIDDICELPAVRSRPNWVDQIDRASMSISNNIAEGFERGTTNELLAFIYIARGSAGEVRSMLRYGLLRPRLAHLKAELESLVDSAISVSKQLRGWAESLQSSDIRGQRHLTDRTRASHQRHQRAEAFWTKVRDAHRAKFEKGTNNEDDE